MSLRTTLRTRRRICGAMLVVWVFAIGAGSVNACALTAHEPPGSPHATTAVFPSEADDHHGDEDDEFQPAGGLSNHDASAPSHGSHEDGHAGCHKFCKDESATLPKHAALDSPTFAPLLIDTRVALPTRPISDPLVHRDAERPWANGPPIPLRFLRLTL